jgi:hypothetical protein
LRYPEARNITIVGGLVGSTSTSGGLKTTTFSAGSGTVAWS